MSKGMSEFFIIFMCSFVFGSSIVYANGSANIISTSVTLNNTLSLQDEQTLFKGKSNYTLMNDQEIEGD